VRVSFNFNYHETAIETSYLTTVKEGLGNFLEISLIQYTHGRDRISMNLPDGSLVLLRPEWPFEGKNFERGKKSISTARWLWQDRVDQPSEIIYGAGASRHVAIRAVSAQFTWLDVTATIERLDRSYLPEALRADSLHDDDDKIEFSNFFGGSSNFHGTLFTGLNMLPLSVTDGTEVEHLTDAPGWIAASDNCRFRAVEPGDFRALSAFVRNSDRVGLLRAGTRWRGDAGPHPGEPLVMYSTEAKVDGRESSFSVVPFRHLALNMLRELTWDGMACGGIEPPGSGQSLLVQFVDGRLALIEPSDNIAVVGK
jgi:hypothetical protein